MSQTRARRRAAIAREWPARRSANRPSRSWNSSLRATLPDRVSNRHRAADYRAQSRLEIRGPRRAILKPTVMAVPFRSRVRFNHADDVRRAVAIRL
jgi:hypothetical protein